MHLGTVFSWFAYIFSGWFFSCTCADLELGSGGRVGGSETIPLENSNFLNLRRIIADYASPLTSGKLKYPSDSHWKKNLDPRMFLTIVRNSMIENGKTREIIISTRSCAMHYVYHSWRSFKHFLLTQNFKVRF